MYDGDSLPAERSSWNDSDGLESLSPALRGVGRTPVVRGGLAPWQAARVRTHVEKNLSATLHVEDLAALVQLSSHHFSRVFRTTFGVPPHQYIMRRRVELAQVLLLTTHHSLGTIAVDCGLADQPHFSRMFRRYLGKSPGAWRRSRVASTGVAARPRRVMPG